MGARLTPRQERFLDEYLIDLNATQAAIRAGYAPKAATQVASRVLTKANVQGRLAEKREALAAAVEITPESVLRELAKLGFSNMGNYTRVLGDVRILDLSEVTPDQLAAISELVVEEYTDGRGEFARDVKRVKMKLHPKHSALVSIGEHLGMFSRKLELSGKVTLEQLVTESLKRDDDPSDSGPAPVA